jgi:hypothetical protein
MTPTAEKRARVYAAAVALTLGLAAGTYVATSSPDGRRAQVAWPAGRPAQVECLRVTGLASVQVRQVYGLDTSSGRPEYVDGCWCADASADAGTVGELPSGMLVVDGTQEDAPECGTYWVDVSMPGEVGNRCACSTGSACEVQAADGTWGPAPLGMTLPEGQWRGEGCYPKVCVEMAGQSSWNAEACPLQ